jgi:hypothetical protein
MRTKALARVAGAQPQTTAPAISLTPTPKDQLGKFAEGCLAVLKDRDMYLAGKTQRGAAD